MRLTHSNPVLDGVRFAKQEVVEWKGTDGWRVWVTLPSAALGYGVGETIELRANITISDDDPKFAFAKRPFLLSEVKDSITL